RPRARDDEPGRGPAPHDRAIRPGRATGRPRLARLAEPVFARSQGARQLSSPGGALQPVVPGREVKKPSRLSALADRAAALRGGSSGVLVAGLAIACAIEVAVDWNPTLYEINVLRSGLRQKGENSADILRKAAEVPMAAYDWDELDRLSSRLFDDPEVV